MPRSPVKGGFTSLDQVTTPVAQFMAGRGEINVALAVDGKAEKMFKISVN
jgi:hypothetical protein